MKTISFDAAYIHISEEADYYLVGFSDREKNFKNYVMLQLAYFFDEDDIANDMDGEYFEYNGQACCGYKCVKEAILNNHSILFKLRNLSKEFDQIEVHLENAAMTPELMEHLKIILGSKLSVQHDGK